MQKIDMEHFTERVRRVTLPFMAAFIVGCDGNVSETRIPEKTLPSFLVQKEMPVIKSLGNCSSMHTARDAIIICADNAVAFSSVVHFQNEYKAMYKTPPDTINLRFSLSRDRSLALGLAAETAELPDVPVRSENIAAFAQALQKVGHNGKGIFLSAVTEDTVRPFGKSLQGGPMINAPLENSPMLLAHRNMEGNPEIIIPVSGLATVKPDILARAVKEVSVRLEKMQAPGKREALTGGRLV